MAIFFDCSFCSYGKNVPDSYRGKKIKCPRCLATLTLGVPQPTALTALPLPEEDDESPLNQIAIELDQGANRVECPFCFEVINAVEKECPFCNKSVAGVFESSESENFNLDQERAPEVLLTDSQRVKKIFICSSLSLIVGVGSILGPIALVIALRECKAHLRKEIQKMLDTSIVMAIIGTLGSLVLCVVLLWMILG